MTQEEMDEKWAMIRLDYMTVNERRWLALSESTPAEILARLARDVSPCVRRCVARNPSAPAEVLRKLADDTNEAVRIAAQTALSRLSDAPTRA